MGAFTFRSRVGWQIAAGGLIALGAVAVRVLLAPVLGDQVPFMMAAVGVLFATRVSGSAAGISAAVAGGFLTDGLVVPPQGFEGLNRIDHLLAVLLFQIVATALVVKVSRWRRSERHLRQRTAELQATLDAVPAAVFVTHDREGRRVEGNRLADAFLRMAPGENLSQIQRTDSSVRIVRHGVTVDPRDLPIRVAAAHGIEVRDYECDLVYPDGTARTVFGHAAPLTVQDGHSQGAVCAFVDVTQAARARAILERYEMLARHTRDIILFTRRADGRILEANDAAVGAYGYSREALLGLRLQDLQESQETAPTDAQIAEAETSGILFETWHRRLDGTRFPVEVSARATDGASGESLVLNVVREITERKRVEREVHRLNLDLQAHVAELEQLMAVTPVGVVIAEDADANVMRANPALQRMLGAKPDDNVSVTASSPPPWRIVKNGREQVGLELPIQRCARLGVEVPPEECDIQFDDGRLLHVLVSAAPLFSARGEPRGAISVMVDITDRRRAEEVRVQTMGRVTRLLEISEALSAAATPEEIISIVLEKGIPALDAYAGVVGIVTGAGDTLEVAGAAGYRDGGPQTGYQLPLAASSPLTDAAREGRTVVVSSPGEWADRYPAIAGAPEGGTRPLVAVPLRGRTVFGALGLSYLQPIDFDEKAETFAGLLGRQLAQALERASLLVSERRAHDAAESSNRVKDEFLQTLSHELNTPLHAIVGWSQMLATGTLDAATQRRAIEVIGRNAQTQARLVSDVLDLSRIVTGTTRLELKPVDMRGVIERALDVVRLAAEAKELTLDVSLDGALLTRGDADRLQQVVWNLLSNAVKFTPKGGRVRLRAARRGTDVTLVVQDNGVGVAPEFLPHIFERFTQADASTTRTYGGLGLGLAIVRHLVELHGGTVSATSPGKDQGASFTVCLPALSLAASAEPLGDSRDADQQPVPPLPPGLKVLLVDDDQDSLDVVATILRSGGASVETATSAARAMDQVRAWAPDVLISDIGMPEEDGYVFIGRVRRLPGALARIPAIALTAYRHARERDLALAAGYDHHVAKPVSAAALIAAVGGLVAEVR